MGRRMNFTPRLPTIIVALVLMLVGLLGTFAAMLPAVAGIEGEALGAWLLIAGGAVMLLGMVFEGI